MPIFNMHIPVPDVEATNKQATGTIYTEQINTFQSIYIYIHLSISLQHQYLFIFFLFLLTATTETWQHC